MNANENLRQLASVGSYQLVPHRYFGVKIFNRGYAGAEFYGVPVGVEYDLQARDDAEQIGKIEIAEMRDAEDLAFH